MGRSVEDILSANGIDGVADENSLEHYGVPGMRWGKRRKAKKAAVADYQAKKAAVESMSDDELKKKINRIKLEREYDKLTAPEVSEGRKVVVKLLREVGEAKAKSYMMNNASDDLRSILKASAKPAATPSVGRVHMKLVGQT